MGRRIYKVMSGGEIRLVDARTKLEALRHVAQMRYVVTIAEQAELVRYMERGIKIENAGEYPELKDE